MAVRSLSKYESDLLQILISANRKYISIPIELNDLEAEEIDEVGSLKFRRRSGADTRQTKLPSEGTLTDSDGIDVHALLFACAGELDELQIYKDDGSPLRATPRIEQWKVF